MVFPQEKGAIFKTSSGRLPYSERLPQHLAQVFHKYHRQSKFTYFGGNSSCSWQSNKCFEGFHQSSMLQAAMAGNDFH